MKIRFSFVKICASILVLTFLVLQYGKLASYWECRLSAESAAAICECEKTLLDTHKEGISGSAATAIAKEKTEESYLWEISVKNLAAQTPVNHTPSSLYPSMIPEDHTQHIFQPPRA